jgi:undecaprenyl diphosphate synthase
MIGLDHRVVKKPYSHSVVNLVVKIESYDACAAEVARHLPAVWTAVEVLPADVRPHMHALHAFASRTDRIADEGGEDPAGRARRLAQWRADTMSELRAGVSADPLRGALIDTVRRYGLDHALFEEFFDAMESDCAAAPEYESFADLRGYLRGVSGTIAEMWGPLLGLQGGAGAGLSVVGELFQLIDVLEDLPVDLKAGRCYLPRADLRRLGLQVEDLQGSSEVLDELVDVQLAHGRELLEQAIPAIELVGADYQPFLQSVILGAQVQFDETELLRSRALTEGIAPLTSISSRDGVPRLLDVGTVPDHVAVIMDGNRRWAAQRGLPTARGHRAGEWAVARTVHAALRLGVRHLTVYAFSTENWSRSPDELAALFETMTGAIARCAEWLHERGVRIRWCGRRDRLDESLVAPLALVESMTSNNTALALTLCVDYGGRDELAAAARALAAEAVAGTIRPTEIGPDDLARHLYVPELPDVDLLIRTSGEQRISNFLPWQLAYAELVFDPTPWPDYGLVKLRRAVDVYTQRRRSFGGDAVTPSAGGTPLLPSGARVPSPR